MAIKKSSRSSINIKGRFIIYGIGAGPGRGERNQTTRKGGGQIFWTSPEGHEDPKVVHALAQGLC